jgi:hypothetical protein
MQDEGQESHSAKISVTVPEKQFGQWLKEESKTTRLKIRCDLTKESLPYVTALLIVVLTTFVPREALIAVVSPVLIWILHSLRNRLG